MTAGHIIAIGGAGFAEAPAAPALERYLLAQAGKPRPRVCFIGSASGDNDWYVARFYETFGALDCTPSHLALFRRTRDARAHLLAQDLVYVGGGNTKSLLALWRDWGLPELLREAAANGCVLAGTSAGAICWFDAGVTDSWGDGLRVLPALGFLPGSCCPHYDGEAERQPFYRQAMVTGAVQPGHAIGDRAALHFHDGTLLRAIATQQDAMAFHVSSEAGVCIEAPLPVQLLADDGMPLPRTH